MNKKRFVALISVFFVCVAIVVAANVLKWPGYRHAMVLPVLYLAALTFVVGKGRGLWLPLGLLFSTAGDLMGSMGLFIPQIGCFALAHVSYIIYFLRRAWLRPGLLVACVAVLAVAVGLGFVILPHVESVAEKAAVLAYIVVISLMCMSAILWRGENKVWYITAAVLFMFSDTVIALNRFVTPIPYSSVIIMTTYYSAQVILAGAYLSRFMRDRRFNPAIRA